MLPWVLDGVHPRTCWCVRGAGCAWSSTARRGTPGAQTWACPLCPPAACSCWSCGARSRDQPQRTACTRRGKKPVSCLCIAWQLCTHPTTCYSWCEASQDRQSMELHHHHCSCKVYFTRRGHPIRPCIRPHQSNAQGILLDLYWGWEG